MRDDCPLLLLLYCVFTLLLSVITINVSLSLCFLLLACSSTPTLPLSLPACLPALYLGESSPAHSESHYSLQLQRVCVICSLQASVFAYCKGLTAPCASGCFPAQVFISLQCAIDVNGMPKQKLVCLGYIM